MRPTSSTNWLDLPDPGPFGWASRSRRDSASIPTAMTDRATLLSKLTTVVETGTTLVGLFFDDLAPAPGLGTKHGSLTAWLRAELPGEVDLFMAPLHYTGVERVPYLVRAVRGPARERRRSRGPAVTS